ncbi:ImmA/IrrE family metallo-endopeptidase [Clostridium sp. MSJ-11]|uniref:ImmA/IrrE family metallo-endopeptidase n=1 Tax=Clostridium mobile TaxID=2841512 RepID=A0ABS6EJ43_9CLOT|nr:ImmA/IrrE family metallo-endopeptidase [Clostridium mobile]MBU5485238.1 ImmA/IrrE family metallo-endopeptidase [Clostridium mobile]
MEYKWIDNFIDGLIDVYGTKDIYELYDSLEISIRKLPKCNILLQGNEAFYNRNFLNKEVVFIRDDLNMEYEKFILCHELGHAIIHTNIITSAFSRNLLNLNKLEKQANYFALKLMDLNMDEIAFEGFTIEQIANSFNLPVKCLKLLLDSKNQNI